MIANKLDPLLFFNFSSNFWNGCDLQYGYEGRVPLRSARLFYDVSEKARKIIESYFMLNSTLHFSYTHLVCRTAVPGVFPAIVNCDTQFSFHLQ